MNTDLHLARSIAIIGMAGRFPGANTLEEFWHNLQSGQEAISFFSDEELLSAGVPASYLARRDYIKARGSLDQVEFFDAAFFGFTPKEAEIADPQQRIFLETAWEAIEDAGYDPLTYDGSIGLYAGCGGSSYLILNLLATPDLSHAANSFQIMLGNEKDFLTTQVSYKLNLRGPSMTVQTACSTSLVAVHLACQSLLLGECDMALAGGVSITLPNRGGYFYQEGGIHSADGHCYAFDARGTGFVTGNGTGAVLLKRLDLALEDCDHIYAVIRGTAVNNDGSLKVGYTAPSYEGQTRVIAEAMAIADVSPATIGYVEAHGTGTRLGDPVEMAALSEAFQEEQPLLASRAIGSVKATIGHLGAAAGVSSLIKTALALTHRQFPPSPYFERPNPQIDFVRSPFYVNTTLEDWPRTTTPRRASVNSLGIGGTNAHLILEEAPECEPTGQAPLPWQLLLLSARTPSALENATARLVAFCRQHPEASLADIAYTLQVGRHQFAERRMLVCQDREEACRLLEERNPLVLTHHTTSPGRVVFFFPGQGTQYLDMAQSLSQHLPVFRHWLDTCADLLCPWLHLDIRQVLFPGAEEREAMARQLASTAIAQPALFVIEYALARQLIELGLQPGALLGHSLGEYVAACLAGVFSLADALALVAVRGQLMQETPAGSMLSIPLPPEQLTPLLGTSLALAAINAPAQCVVSGPPPAIADLQASLTAQGITCRLLQVNRATHSPLLASMEGPFLARLQAMTLHAPTIPFLSNVTGTWITEAQATNPAYWVAHLRQTVRFSDGVQELGKQRGQVWVEVGPGKTLTPLLIQHKELAEQQTILSTLRPPRHDDGDDLPVFLQALGKYWLTGGQVAWAALHAQSPRQRLSLPTYPFERQRYWIGPDTSQPEPSETTGAGLQATSAETPGGAEPRPSTPRASFVAASTDIEQTILIIWREVLGIEQIGIYDDFFESGGNSLIATQLMTRLRDIFPVELPLRTLFAAPTIAGLAEALEKKFIEHLEALPEEVAEQLLHGADL